MQRRVAHAHPRRPRPASSEVILMLLTGDEMNNSARRIRRPAPRVHLTKAAAKPASLYLLQQVVN